MSNARRQPARASKRAAVGGASRAKRTAPTRRGGRIVRGVIRLPRNASGAIIFGGSFDPPHRWHTTIAAAARRKLFPRTGWIIIIPAARSPFKDRGPQAPDADRLRMLELATAGMQRVIIWTEELDRAAAKPGQPSFTIDTLRTLRKQLGDRLPLRLLIGADQAAGFHKWKLHREIAALAEPLVVRRPPVTRETDLRPILAATKAWTPAELDRWLKRVIDCRTNAVSSTHVRAALAGVDQHNRPGTNLTLCLSPAVLRHAIHSRVYAGVPPTKRDT